MTQRNYACWHAWIAGGPSAARVFWVAGRRVFRPRAVYRGDTMTSSITLKQDTLHGKRSPAGRGRGDHYGVHDDMNGKTDEVKQIQLTSSETRWRLKENRRSSFDHPAAGLSEEEHRAGTLGQRRMESNWSGHASITWGGRVRRLARMAARNAGPSRRTSRKKTARCSHSPAGRRHPGP